MDFIYCQLSHKWGPFNSFAGLFYPLPAFQCSERTQRGRRRSARAEAQRGTGMDSGSKSWSIDSYLNEHFDIPAKNPPSEARLRWRRAVGLVVRNRRRRFRMFSGLHALDDAQRRNILVRTSLWAGTGAAGQPYRP